MLRGSGHRSHVAWDIETTGLSWSDQITVSGFWLPDGRARLILNTNGDDVDMHAFDQHLEDVSGGVPVTVITTSDEQGLLQAMHQLVFDYFDRDYNRLIAFNAESWKSGFDLPFTRTSCIAHGVDWMFDGIEFADLWDPLKKRLNTTYSSYGSTSETNSLTGSHAILFDQHHLVDQFLSEWEGPWYRDHEYDPFDDSGSAIGHYQRGDYLPVLQHNLADVHRTWELGELIRVFVSQKDITAKKL
ncbi:hypothetical protein [Halomarina ordinaria]|uniref:Uncharacterized protein n=1 Tax=Halomarina ordinaria TaxID=3033939 RepID=A0ABD5UDK1_9EURY|nr:hypothetical protein [Halomarina sp. PSRA2]